jgi:hypothetical protein
MNQVEAELDRRSDQPYEKPLLVHYGTIEEWTKGMAGALINLSIVI